MPAVGARNRRKATAKIQKEKKNKIHIFYLKKKYL